VLKANPKHAEAHASLGQILDDQGSVDQAIEHYREAIALKPQLGLGHRSLAKALMKKGDVKGAVAEYRSAVGLMPQDSLL
jgi:Flp pilus assembly protein TadD